jgi:hypothetical protein
MVILDHRAIIEELLIRSNFPGCDAAPDGTYDLTDLPMFDLDATADGARLTATQGMILQGIKVLSDWVLRKLEASTAVFVEADVGGEDDDDAQEEDNAQEEGINVPLVQPDVLTPVGKDAQLYLRVRSCVGVCAFERTMVPIVTRVFPLLWCCRTTRTVGASNWFSSRSRRRRRRRREQCTQVRSLPTQSVIIPTVTCTMSVFLGDCVDCRGACSRTFRRSTGSLSSSVVPIAATNFECQ